MGATKQAKGRAGERQGRQAAQRIPERHSHPATTRASSPQGATVARSASATSGSALGDARGGAPCIRKQKISPFPGWEERSASAGGGMGATKQAKGRAGGRQGRQAAPQGTAGAGRAVRKKANAQIIQATATAAFGVAFTLRIYSPQSFLRKILKTSCNLRRIVV